MSQRTDKSSAFCLITGEGKGAIATIWVSGPAALSAIANCFRPNSGPKAADIKIGQVVYGDWIFHDAPIEVTDSGLPESSRSEDLIVVRVDNSTFEIHSHGGTQSWKWLNRSLLQAGLIQLSVEEYSSRVSKSWLNSELSQTVPLAVTDRTALFLLDQSIAWVSFACALRDCCNREDQPSLLDAITSIQDWKEFGLHLTKPWRVVIAGQPNVGKSSMINALAGFSRSIVHDHPGTTRDVVSQRAAFDGWPVELKDTAGLRIGDSEIESLGIEKAWQEVRAADCRIAVFDASQRWTAADRKLLDEIRPQIVAFNKVDQLLADSTRAEGMFVSATQNLGIDELGRAIARVIVPYPPTRHQPVPFNERLNARLEILSQLVGEKNWDAVRREVDDFTTDDEL